MAGTHSQAGYEALATAGYSQADIAKFRRMSVIFERAALAHYKESKKQ